MTTHEDLHRLGVHRTDDTVDVEAVDPAFLLEGFLAAQAKTWDTLHVIRAQLREGMTEDEARRLALQIFADHGVQKHWHKPYIRLGPGTALSYHNPFQPTYRLQPGDPFFIDVGPIWPAADPRHRLSYEGDVGDSFVFGGTNPAAHACIEAVHALFAQGQQAWAHQYLSGQQLYDFLENQAKTMGYRLIKEVDGHRLSDFPHHKYSRDRLAHLPFHPKAHAWVLEVQIVDPAGRFGAFFEDLLT